MTSIISESFLGETIKLGVDMHKDSYVVCAKVDGSEPMRACRMSPEDFFGFAAQVLPKCRELHACYEAGCFGYEPHRRLLAMGARSYVVRPVNLDPHSSRVKTDHRDARQLALYLDGYVLGNDRSFSVVRAPAVREERLRSVTRHREALMKQRRRLANMGSSNARFAGVEIPGAWHGPRAFAELEGALGNEELLGILGSLREVILCLDGQIEAYARRIEAMDKPALPKGMASSLFQQLEREAGDWGRFASGRKVGSYTGLCPSEDTSAGRRFQGGVTKSGNRRMRRLLVEFAWLLWRWNPGYVGFDKWRVRMLEAKMTKSGRKKMIVAIARQLAVHWWQIRTGRKRPEELGLEMKKA